MGLELGPFDAASAPRGLRVTASAKRLPAGLMFHFAVTGPVDELLVPAPALPTRSDGLWRHLCFEAFLRPTGGDGYLELNFAPSAHWAAYAFSDYRAGMKPADGIGAPTISVSQNAARLTLDVTVPLLADNPLSVDRAWDIGLSAVLEGRDGRLSYWALAHPPGKADFHHGDCFALQLAAAEAS